MAEETQYVLGIDASTIGVRAGLFDLRGQPLGFAEQSVTTAYPAPGQAVQQPEDWWQALIEVVHRCRVMAGIDPAHVIGLAIDAPANVFLVDREGWPLTPALLYMDRRSAAQAGRLTATADPALRYCGGTIPAEWPLPKALWLKENEPVLWKQAALLTETMGWLNWRLTGVWTLGLCSAVCRWHYRPGTGWPRSLLEAGGLAELGQYVPQAGPPMGGRIGTLTAAAAEELGLTTATIVSLSGLDSCASMVGINAFQIDTLAIICGWSTCQLALSAEPVFDPGILGPFESAVVAGAWMLEAGQSSTGSTVRWLIDLMDGTALGTPVAGDSDAHIEELATATPPGADGILLLDHWLGSGVPNLDAGARGAVTGLTLDHGPGQLLRAVYEGTAYGNRRIMARLADIGVPITRIVACGSSTPSKLWMQILADVAGTAVELTAVPDAAALGSAICAAVGAGAYPDLQTAADAMVYATGVFSPEIGPAAIYDRGYGRYVATYNALHGVRVNHQD